VSKVSKKIYSLTFFVFSFMIPDHYAVVCHTTPTQNDSACVFLSGWDHDE